MGCINSKTSKPAQAFEKRYNKKPTSKTHATATKTETQKRLGAKHIVLPKSSSVVSKTSEKIKQRPKDHTFTKAVKNEEVDQVAAQAVKDPETVQVANVVGIKKTKLKFLKIPKTEM